MIDEELEFKVEQLDLMIKRWKRLGALYRKVATPGDASPKEEREYGDLATYFTRTYQALAMRCGLKIDPQTSVLTMVTDIADATGIRDMDPMLRRKFESDWRLNNTLMNRKLGELQLLSKELEEVSAFAYHAKRFFAIPAVQWSVGLSVVVILLGLFGVFGYLYSLASDFISKM